MSQTEAPARVLVAPAGTQIGLEIHASLDLSKHWNLFGANSVADQSQLRFHNWFGGLPNVRDAAFAAAVGELAAAHRIEFIIPAHDEAAYVLAGRDLGGATLVGPGPELATVLRFKSRTYEALRDVVRCPHVYSLDQMRSAPLPLFAKPDRGQGSRGARAIRTEADRNAALQDPEPLLFSELLTGDEFTVDCFTDRHGVLKYAEGRLRERISNGISVRAQAAPDPRFLDMATRISSALGVRGAWFFQVKLSADGDPAVLEVANRVSGTMGYQRDRGINLVDAWLHDLKGREVRFIPWTFGEVVYDRALAANAIWDYRPEAIYVDFDDTLVLPTGKLNYHLVGALYGLRFNLGTRLILVTRHQQEIEQALGRLALDSLFHEVRHLRRGEPKSDIITHQRAILIDDSFAERAEVHARRRIPTFSVEATACLESLNHAAMA